MANGLQRGHLNSLQVVWDYGSFSGLDDRGLLARFVIAATREASLPSRSWSGVTARWSSRSAATGSTIATPPRMPSRRSSWSWPVEPPRIRTPEKLASWLHGVAIRTAKEARSRERKRRRIELRGATMPPTVTGSPDHPPSRLEEAEALHSEIARLPDRYRNAVVLCDLEGLTQQEAATRLRCPTGTIAVRLKRARERLRVRLSRRGLEPSAGLMILGQAPGRSRRSRRASCDRRSGPRSRSDWPRPRLFPRRESGNDDDTREVGDRDDGLDLGLASIWGLASWRLHPRPQSCLRPPPRSRSSSRSPGRFAITTSIWEPPSPHDPSKSGPTSTAGWERSVFREDGGSRRGICCSRSTAGGPARPWRSPRPRSS